ncbi:autotransporter outer membrane beta-barrel domain-containing protein [Frigidibacter albus]
MSCEAESKLPKAVTTAVLILFLTWIAPNPGRAADDPPPSGTSPLGATVFNPKTGQSTTVAALIRDPASTPTQGNVAFVQTADGYTFLVKTAGQTFYNADVPPVAFTVVSVTDGVATISAEGNVADVAFGITNAEYAEQLAGEDTENSGHGDPGGPGS